MAVVPSVVSSVAQAYQPVNDKPDRGPARLPHDDQREDFTPIQGNDLPFNPELPSFTEPPGNGLVYPNEYVYPPFGAAEDNGIRREIPRVDNGSEPVDRSKSYNGLGEHGESYTLDQSYEGYSRVAQVTDNLGFTTKVPSGRNARRVLYRTDNPGNHPTFMDYSQRPTAAHEAVRNEAYLDSDMTVPDMQANEVYTPPVPASSVPAGTNANAANVTVEPDFQMGWM